MKTLHVLPLALTLALGNTIATSCMAGDTVVVRPSSHYTTKRISLTDIEAITTSSSVDVVYHPSAGAPYAEIYAPDNVVPYIQVEQKGHQLNVGIQHPDGNRLSIEGKCRYEVRVYAPEVTSFTSGSSGDILIQENIQTEKPIRLSANSSGNIKASSITCGLADLCSQSSGDILVENLRCTSGEFKSSSSGDCYIHSLNSLGNVSVSTGSSGDCKVDEMACEGNLSISSSSSGDCKIDNLRCTGDVDASTSSSADIYLSGTCRNASLSASSAGSVYAKDLKAVDVKASATSAGCVECQASGTLTPHASSGGEIRYKGEPQHINAQLKGLRQL
ncbi:MAG: DUF2807 domain-containing protein [Phocaeicola plebeius]|nr:DUF2807 domain-containing protein [Phocaeicola plebeius]